MSVTKSRNESSDDTSIVPKADMKVEIIVIPVSDVDRAKGFYAALGWRLDADISASKQYRVVQFTPPGSACSIIFGSGVTPTAPGSVQGLYLIVSNIEVARADLLDRGVKVSEPFYDVSGLFHHLNGEGIVTGLQPQRKAMEPMRPLAILMVTGGFCRRSPHACLGVCRPLTSSLPRLPSSQALCDGRQRLTRSINVGSAGKMPIGRIGTRSTSSRSRPVSRFRPDLLAVVPSLGAQLRFSRQGSTLPAPPASRRSARYSKAIPGGRAGLPANRRGRLAAMHLSV